ncbi:XAC0095 family protein [Xanthomonas campestris]|uniref:XAC0095 family protein n=1 Tax=Xanthomonas campestris TaxID=339 RepID=UPI003CCF3C13
MLARPRCMPTSGINETPVPIDALAFCFDLLAEQLDDVLMQTKVPDEMTERRASS